ncbi:hypothetical protein D5086_003495 [Populus alba]|uniref:Uncharacterized protein n=1 Tax=Populus alba TaxID=43335 RepID=A0ACC4D5M6_POPAL
MENHVDQMVGDNDNYAEEGTLIIVKLGTLALKTFCKPIANRLKKEAGLHPKFRHFIINMAQVAGAAVIFEVQRSSRSEARKEEKRRQEIEMVEKGWDMVDIGVEYLVGSLHRTADLLCFVKF